VTAGDFVLWVEWQIVSISQGLRTLQAGNERQRVLGRKTPAKTVSELDLVNTA
jgi:hypothetical protein